MRAFVRAVRGTSKPSISRRFGFFGAGAGAPPPPSPSRAASRFAAVASTPLGASGGGPAASTTSGRARAAGLRSPMRSKIQ